MLRLTENSVQLLRKCLENYNKKLLWVIDSKDMVEIDLNLGNALRDAISNELVKYGFEKDEPNSYGIQLENLIDEIGRYFL